MFTCSVLVGITGRGLQCFVVTIEHGRCFLVLLKSLVKCATLGKKQFPFLRGEFCWVASSFVHNHSLGKLLFTPLSWQARNRQCPHSALDPIDCAPSPIPFQLSGGALPFFATRAMAKPPAPFVLPPSKFWPFTERPGRLSRKHGDRS